MDFGYHNGSFVSPDGEGPQVEALLDRARFLDEAGFTWFSVMDHLWQISGNGYHDEPFLDAYTTLPALATATDDIELGALVTCVHYRNPAMLGRMLASLDHLSGGRAVLGIGAGWFRAEYEAYGYEYPDPATRIHQMADAIRLVKAMWTEPSPLDYEGEHYAVEDLILEPKPVRDPHPPVLVGGGGEQLTLRAAADLADRWNIPGGTPENYAHKLSVLREHCADLGTDYDDIQKTVGNVVVVRDTTEAAHEAYEGLLSATERGPSDRDSYRGLVGTPAEVAAGVEAFREAGAETFMLKVPKNDPETVERFVDEVAPEFQ